MPTLDQIIPLLLHFSYAILFVLIAIEGPIVTIVAGLLSSMGIFNFFLAYLVIISGDLIGDGGYYALGRFGRKAFFDKWGYLVGVNPHQLATMEKKINRNSGKTMLMGKLAHGIGGIFIVTAGIVKMPFRDFLWYNLLGTIPKSLLLMLVGYYFGKSFVQFSKYLNYTALGTMALAILATLVYFVIRIKASKNVR
jgi:membrane protein DedA with SNARE-associated domain